MTATHLNPYLAFDGACRDAMQFYQSCLGGKLTMQTFGETPMPAPEGYKDKIMHAMLESDAILLMGSDSPPHNTVTQGNTVSLSLVGSDEAGLKEMFRKLSAGGKVTMPLEKQFWGDTFGMLIDKFGLQWMVNINAK